MAESTGFSKSDVARVLQGVLDEITGALEKGKTLRISGFGTFSIKEVGGMHTPAKHPGFRFARAIWERVNNE